jgi:hypothetical protein
MVSPAGTPAGRPVTMMESAPVVTEYATSTDAGTLDAWTTTD